VGTALRQVDRGGRVLTTPTAEQLEKRARERELVDRAREGDSSAFEQLYRDNAGRVFAVCYRMAGDAALAEELTQDAFVRAWQRLDSFRGDSAFSSWLHPLAVNVALTERRSRRRRLARVVAVEDLANEAGAAPAHDPGAAMDIEKALLLLPPGARETFVMHDVEGWQHDEIADRTGVAVGTSKAQLHRARKLLRAALTRVKRLGGRR
jgi:RNA polymerase sigma-70 factor, ECF subfamily